MVKKLRIFSSYKKYKINKLVIHKLVNVLTNDLDFIVESLPINFISSDQIITINKEYLNHNYSTDIITFNYSGSKKNLDGEIFISIDDAKVNAKAYNNSLKEELLRLVIHGILHLLGYDDIKKSDFKKMKELENSLLNKYKITLLK
ncbi:MAG: rRNA maturation RNase YbeY [Ignavibacteriaceae bacterium]